MINFYQKVNKAARKKKMNTHLGEGCALSWPDWYCKVASNIDSAITTLFSISAIEAEASSYFSCIHVVVVVEGALYEKESKIVIQI